MKKNLNEGYLHKSLTLEPVDYSTNVSTFSRYNCNFGFFTFVTPLGLNEVIVEEVVIGNFGLFTTVVFAVVGASFSLSVPSFSVVFLTK